MRHLGPAFSFTLIDTLSLMSLMETNTEASFDKDHPAPALRFREQVNMLTRCGWWPMESLPSEHIALMHKLASMDTGSYEFVLKEEWVPAFIEAFREIVPLIHDLILDLTDHCNGARKPSIARTFTLVETAPWIHPEYRGCLTLEIANVSNTPVLLYPGRPIGQLILLHVGRSHDVNECVKSSYFGPVHPEAPHFKNPEQDLLKIGVRRTEVIRKGVIDDGGAFEPFRRANG